MQRAAPAAMDPTARLLFDAFLAAVDTARAGAWLPPALAEVERPAGRTRVLAVGKGAADAAEAFARTWEGPFEGLLIAPHGTSAEVDGFRALTGAHPAPDAGSLAAGEAALALAAATGPDDLLLVLLSGGASALMCAPIEGLSLETKAELTAELLRSGASIGELNAVRRACSRVKGGGLLRAASGRVVTLAVSDVPGDVLADIGSGPGVPSPTGAAEALAVVARRAPSFLGRLAPLLHRRPSGPEAAWAARVAFRPADALAAAAAVLQAAGVEAEVLGADLAGEARLVGAAHARRLGAASRALLSGGELEVTLAGASAGRGGRNQEYLLAVAAELAGRADVWGLAADTDGRDGSAPAAGAWVDPAWLAALDPVTARAALDGHDAHGLFAPAGRALVTGSTGVNVGDFRLLLVAPAGRAP